MVDETKLAPKEDVKLEPKPESKPAITKEVAKKAVAAVKKAMPKPVKKTKKVAKKSTRKTKKITKKPSKLAPKRAKKASPKKAKSDRRPGRRGVGAAKRTRVVEKFRALIDAGASRQEAARQVKFADLTLRRWEAAMGLKPASSRGKGGGKRTKAKGTKVKGTKAKAAKTRKPGRPKGKVAKKRGRPRGRPAAKPVGRPRGRPRKVREVAERSAGGLVLVTPSGLRVGGIQIGDLLKVLQTIK